MALRPRKITEHSPSEILSVVKQDRTHYAAMVQRAIQKGEPRDGEYLFKNGRIYCPKKRGEMVFVRYTSIFHEQI